MKILICDDDKTSLTKVDLVVRKLGYETMAFSDSREASAALCGAHSPKVAILDWMMPELSGLDLCRLVRERSTPVSTYLLMLTSRDTSSDLAEALGAGANDFIAKPFDPIELSARLAAGIRIVTLEQEVRTLTGLLPICSWCKKIRDEKQAWIKMEEYVEKHSHSHFSHGICTGCLATKPWKVNE